MPAVLITPMLIGAAVGAVGAAINGGNILKGALMGAIGGAIGGAFTGALGGGASGAAAGAEGALASGAVGAEGAAAAGAVDAVGAAGASGATGPNFAAGFTDGGTAGMIGNAAPAVAGPTTGLAGPDFSTGFTDGGTATQTGIAAQAPGGTGIANAMDVRLANGQTPGTVASGSGGSSFLDDLLNKGKGMMNSRMVTDTAGRVITGYAQGKNQESALAARQAEINAARANARFAASGSRYNPAGMINSSDFKVT